MRDDMKEKKLNSTLLIVIGIVLVVVLACLYFFDAFAKDNYCTEITFEQLEEKMNNKDTFIIFFGSTICSHCKDFQPTLNQVIKDYAREVYHRDSELIEYGGDNAYPVEDDGTLKSKYGLVKGQYCFKVARIEPENNIEMILQAFVQMPDETIVIVGNWERSEFGKRLKNEYSSYKNIRLLNPIYDGHELNLLRSNCKLYIHGHSVGGTNPSLVEAMNLHLPIIAYDVLYNKETTAID